VTVNCDSGNSENVFDKFEWRGLVYDATPGLRELLAAERLTAYIGFDPTAASLHVGSLLPVWRGARVLLSAPMSGPVRLR
jgi:tyrosyl-tRNA synthetase